MGLLTRMILGGGLRAGTPGPADDFWYRSTGVMTPSGIQIDEDSAKKLSAWYRGRDILATVLAMLPLQVFEKLPNDGGAQQAKQHPLYDVLHDKPNVWQDSFRWRRQSMFHLIDHGNAYARVLSGGRGFVDQLWPLDPRLVTVEQLPSGRLLYRVRDARTNRTSTLTQDEVFHLCGASEDGITGQGILAYARNSIGLAHAMESYAQRIFGKGVLNGGTITVPGQLDPEASKRMAQSFITAAGDWSLPKVLEQGATWEKPDMSPEDFQMILSRKFSIDDMARWLGIPRQMLENNDPSFGNAEQFDRNFIVYSMGPWLSLWEFAIKDQLILNPQRFYAEFNRDAIVRADIGQRWTAHVEAVNAGIKSVDEVRAVEGLNKRGGKADELREPQNITGKPKADDPAAAPRSAQTTRAAAIAQASAARMIRKEVTAVQALAKKHAQDLAQFALAVDAFYLDHVALVEQTLQVTHAVAVEYATSHARLARTTAWVAALQTWSSDSYAAGVAAMALEAA
jgi:HK97 family phage portal protein